MAAAPITSTLADTTSDRPLFYFGVLAGCMFLAGALWLYNEILPIDQKIFGSRGKWKLPPGPKGLPIVGNLISLAQGLKKGGDAGESAMMELGKYGEMTTLHLGSRTWILINSKRVAEEIIAKRGNITAERAHTPVANGIVCRNMKSVLMATEGWKEPRRVMHHLLSGTALEQYGRWQQLESTQLLAEYVHHPEQWYNHNYRYANSVVHRIALGERITAASEDLAALQHLVAEFTGSIGSSIIDWFPILDRVVPKLLQPWRPYWEKLGQWHYDVYATWWKPVKKAVDEGTAPPSWARDVLLNPESKFQGSDDETMYTGMQLIEAGSDSSRQALNVFIMAVIAHPEVLRRLREEVDSFCDTEEGLRMPVMEDMEKMRYCAGAVKEVIRWRPILPIVPEHTLTKDLEFEGYHFPAGVGFVVNGYAVANDCDEYDKFKPERWLDGNEQSALHGLWGFGGGRKVCVGYRLAQRGLFLNIARMAMCFNFESIGYVDSHMMNQDRTTEPFPVKITLRDEKYRKLIHEEAAAAGVLDDAIRQREAFPEYQYKSRSMF